MRQTTLTHWIVVIRTDRRHLALNSDHFSTERRSSCETDNTVAVFRWDRWHLGALPPASLTSTPVANLVSTTLAKLVEKFAARVVDTGGKFSAGVVDTGGKFATSVVDTGGAPWIANISANFRKNPKWSYWYALGLGGNWFMKKTRSKKSRDTVPLIYWGCSHRR